MTTARAHHGKSRGPQLYGNRPVRIVATAGAVVVAVFTLLPIYWLFIAATKTTAEIINSFGLWFSGPFQLVQNVAGLFSYQGGIYAEWLGRTALYAGISGIVVTIVSAMVGYAFARLPFPGHRQFFTTVVGSVMVPSTVTAIPLYFLLSKLGLLNSALGFILPSCVSPIGVYLMRVFTEGSVPVSILEAARLDGAGEGRIFASIVSRLVAPGCATVLLLTFVATWNNYFLPLLIFSGQRLFPVTLGIAVWNSQANIANGGNEALYTFVVTGGLVSIVPLIALFLILQRYWRSGLVLGSMTG
jgi:multiple sugar transport system permease protein